MKSILILFAAILILSNGISYYLGTEHAKNKLIESETITETKTVEVIHNGGDGADDNAGKLSQEIIFEGEAVDCKKLSEAKLLPEAEPVSAFGGTLAGSVNRAIVQVNQKIVKQKDKCGLTLTADEKALLESL